ncbi:hypothetical protein OEZ86_001989 [Tetradesmus obliquus]|nr:hypothetical protein OEZ86_001989 [Tetradesmus obliquus]
MATTVVAGLGSLGAAVVASREEAAADGSCSSGLSTKDSISTIKRLLREVFADHLGFKARLDSLEKAAAEEAEAADDWELQNATGSSASSWGRAPVRVTGWFSAAGVLPWTGESQGADTLGMLHGLGAAGQADGRLMLHSVLAGGKRRITAELAHMPQHGGQALLQLQRLLYRVQIKKSLQLLIAPLGGSIDAIGRAVTPIQADYGATSALRQGHGLSVLDRLGSGKAASFSRGRLSATAGFFVGGSGKTSLAKLQLNGHEGHSLSLIAAKCRPRKAAAAADAAEDGSGSSSSSSGIDQAGLRFLGVQAPGSSSSTGSDAAAGTLLGIAGVLPVRDALTATAWAERPAGGQPGWGVGLFGTPDTEGFEAALVVGKPSTQHAAFRGGAARPLFCELTAKVPVGDGLSICPGALLAVRNGKGTLAYLMQSSWRF